jgi:hypothetical protein
MVRFVLGCVLSLAMLVGGAPTSTVLAGGKGKANPTAKAGKGKGAKGGKGKKGKKGKKGAKAAKKAKQS